MLPSRRLILLVAAAAPIFLAGAIAPPFTAIGVLYLVALAGYAALDALLLPRRRHIGVRRVFPERLSLAAPTQVAWEVTSRLRRPARVELAEVLPLHLEADPASCACALGAGGEARPTARLTGNRRGKYLLAAIDVRVLPAGGLWHRQFRLDLPGEVHVYPNLVNLKRYELLVRRGQLQEGIARLRQVGPGTDFESLRSYTADDEMARIDWKATARQSRLIVRNYQPEREQNVLVALDAGRATAGEFGGISRLDYFVNAALMLAYVVLRQGDWFSLVAFSDHVHSYLPPLRHLKNINQVARALYAVQPRLVESDYGGACRFLSLRSRKRSLVCLMSDVIDRDGSDVLIAYMARFARYHLPLAVVLADPDLHRLARQPLAETDDVFAKAVGIDVLAAREEALAAMRHYGVMVLEADPLALTPHLIGRYLTIKRTRRL